MRTAGAHRALHVGLVGALAAGLMSLGAVTAPGTDDLSALAVPAGVAAVGTTLPAALEPAAAPVLGAELVPSTTRQPADSWAADPSAAPPPSRALAAAALVTQVDVTVNVSGPADGVAGSPYTYTVAVGNNSLPDADGTTFTITTPTGSTAVSASCTASGGATCPAGLITTNAQVRGTAGLLPHAGELVITITGRYAAPSASSVTCTATVSAPTGTTDYDLTSNHSSVATAVTSATSVVVTQTQSTTSMAPGTPNTYTLTWTNTGPAAADGTVTSAMMNFRTNVYDHATISGFSCTASDGLVCPATVATSVGGAFGSVFYQPQASFPAGATMTVTYTADIVAAVPQACGHMSLSIGNDVRATVPNGFSNTGTADLFIYATAPGTPTCPTTDLAVTKSQNQSTIDAGSPVTYTVTYRNAGPSAADGAALSDAMYFTTPVQSLDIHIVSCTPTMGAECPTLADKTLIFSGDAAIQATAPTFPVGSTIEVVYTASPAITAIPACSASGWSSVENRAQIAAPAGVVEVGNQPNQASVYATAPSAPVCPRATLTATKTVDKTTLVAGDTTTYTVTYANQGPDAADGAWIGDYLELSYAQFIADARIAIVSCTGTGGASCPSFITDKTVQHSSYLWSGSVGAFPNGATLTVVVAVTPVAGGTTCSSATATVPNTAYISLPNGVTGWAGSSGAINATAACADISVNKSIDRSSVQPGDPVSYSVRVSNSSPGAARSVQFTDPLPQGFVFGSVTCTPSSATSTCATPAYDPASRTVSAVIPVVGPDQSYVTITITGHAGPVGGTYSNTATAGSPTTGPDRFTDPVPSSNMSTAVLTISGTASRVTVTTRLAGLPAGGVPAPLTFSGSITCSYEGSRPWTATIAAGQSAATSSPVAFFDGQECTVTENPAPSLPVGLTWLGPPLVDPATLTLAGPAADYDVAVTNRLTPNAQLTLAKTASRTEATVGQEVTFTYQVTNGGSVPVSAPVIHETSFSGTGALPPADCPSGEIAPDTSVECSATYTVTASDVVSGLLTNTAYATAAPSAGPEPQTPPASAAVRLVPPPGLALTKSASPVTFAAVGDEIEYTYLVTNTGGLPLTSLTIVETGFDGRGDAPQPDCPASADTLDVREQATCTATYHVTQADLDRGSITNRAVAAAEAPAGFADPSTPIASATVSAARSPSIDLTKSVFPLERTLTPGTTLTYSFVATNTGNVTLTSVHITDTAFSGSDAMSEIVCGTMTLAPQEPTSCSATYRITAADVGAGTLANTATATGTSPTGSAVTSDAGTVVVPDTTAPGPALDLVKTATPTVVHRAGDTIRYTYALTNTGSVPLADPFVAETDFTGSGTVPSPTCPSRTVLPGATVECDAVYTVVASDLRATDIANTATAGASAPDGSTISSEPFTTRAGVVAGTPGLTLETSVPLDALTRAGQRITYSFNVINSGQTPLADITVTETDFTGTGTGLRISCPADRSLAPSTRFTCTATYTATQADIDAGRLVNTARATAKVAGDGLGPLVATDSVVVPARAAPSLELTKSVSPAEPDAFVAGQPITYLFAVVNTGNVTMTDLRIMEKTFTGSGTATPVVCADDSPLAPGHLRTCTATYVLTLADIDDGGLTNSASAVANPPVGGPVSSADAAASLPTTAAPALHLVKSVTPAVARHAGDTVTYRFVVTNIGNVTVGSVAIAETLFTGTGPLTTPTCPASAIAPGQSITCTTTYTATVADGLDGVVDNTAAATGTVAASSPSTAVRAVPLVAGGSDADLPASGTVRSTEASAHLDTGQIATTTSADGPTHRRLATTGTLVALHATLAAALLAAGLLLARVSQRRGRNPREQE